MDVGELVLAEVGEVVEEACGVTDEDIDLQKDCEEEKEKNKLRIEREG